MRIAFIACSGIRACDAELLRMGLTLPGFVERSQTIASLPSLGLLTLAGMCDERHELSYHEAPNPMDWDSLPSGCDLAVISTFSAQVKEAYVLATRLSQQGVRVIMGGPHVSVLPDEAAQYASTIIIGEGECVWPQVLKDAETGQLAARYGELGTAFNLLDAPLPRYELLDPERYNRLTVQTSRGCPHRCEFCAATPVMGSGYRMKSQELVLRDIDRIKEIWQKPFIEFADDNSFVHKAWWKSFLPELKKRKLHWFTECDLAVANDEDLLVSMADAGCAQVLIGFESPAITSLQGLELRGDWKARQVHRYHAAIQCIQDHGIAVNGCFILGLDGQNKNCFEEVNTFVEESGLAEVQVTLQTPFPGTPLYKRLAETNRLLDPTAWERCTLFDLNYIPDSMTPEELVFGFRRLVADLYSEERTTIRRRRFHAQRSRALRHLRHKHQVRATASPFETVMDG